MRKLWLAAALMLAACGDKPADETMPVEPDGGIGTGATPLPGSSPSAAAGIPEFGIPTALQGRWGLSPADCGRDGAEGLLVVSPTTLTFYESVGRLGTIEERSESSIRADFAFSGEGMTWSRELTLTVSGDTLTRREHGGQEPGTGGPFAYTRCTE